MISLLREYTRSMRVVITHLRSEGTGPGGCGRPGPQNPLRDVRFHRTVAAGENSPCQTLSSGRWRIRSNLPQITHLPRVGATILPHGYCSAWLDASYSDLLGDPELGVAGSAASRRSRVWHGVSTRSQRQQDLIHHLSRSRLPSLELPRSVVRAGTQRPRRAPEVRRLGGDVFFCMATPSIMLLHTF